MRGRKKKNHLIIEIVAIETENAKGNTEVFLTVMTLLILVETQLMPLVLLKLPQTISATLQNKGLNKSFPKVEQKLRECFPKY